MSQDSFTWQCFSEIRYKVPFITLQEDNSVNKYLYLG